MTTYTIEVSEEVYQRLQEEAARLHLTPDQVLERVVINDLPHLLIDDDEMDMPIPPPGSPEAFAAVERLASLFANVTIPNVEELLADPMIRSENAYLYNAPPCQDHRPTKIRWITVDKSNRISSLGRSAPAGGRRPYRGQ